MDRHRSEASRWKLLLYIVLIQSDFVPVNGSVTTEPVSVGGMLTSCPGTVVMVTCTYTSTLNRTEWAASEPGQGCRVIANHDNPSQGSICGSEGDTHYIVQNISLSSIAIKSSTLLSVPVDSTFDGSNIRCFEGSSLIPNSEVGRVTLCVIAEPPITSVNGLIQYMVDTPTSGNAMFSVSSVGTCDTDVTYEVTVDPTGPTAQVTGNAVTVTGLDYNTDYTVNIVAVSSACDGLRSGALSVPVRVNAAELPISMTVAKLVCSNSSLPIDLEWIIGPRVLTSINSAVPLNPPMTATVATYTSVGGRMGSVDPPSYHLQETVTDDVYTFNVTVTNVAGDTTGVSSPIMVTAFEVDTSTVATMSCLTVAIRPECSEDVSTGDFSVRLQHGFGACESISLTPETVPLTSQSTCVPVGSNSVDDFCYTATLLYQNNAIETDTNFDFDGCASSQLQRLLGSGVTYELNNAVDETGTFPHLTIATLHCSSGVLTGAHRTTCINRVWRDENVRTCSLLSFEAAIALTFIMTFLVTLVLGISTGVVSVLVYNKCKRGTDQSSSQPTELTSMSGPVYEEPVDFKPDPHTAGNVAYGHVQPLHSRQ